MTTENIYSFTDYKVYLADLEANKRVSFRGFRSRLAEAAGCNNAFISQVLNSGAHFSLEQALNVSRFLKHDERAERYFLSLVELSRAGSPNLREYFLKNIEEQREKHLNIKERVKLQLDLSPEAQATYYSHWYFAAIHMIVTISVLRTPSEIAKALNLKLPLVQKALTFLMSVDLVIEKEGKFFPGPTYLHLEKTSPNIAKHHANWRMRAVMALSEEEKQNIRYSTVSTLSKKDVEILRDRIVQQIQDYVQTVGQSKHEEAMFCFNLDFFKLAE